MVIADALAGSVRAPTFSDTLVAATLLPMNLNSPPLRVSATALPKRLTLLAARLLSSDNVPPELTVKALFTAAPAPLNVSVPPLTLVAPLCVLARVSVKVPVPCLTRPPVPLITPL